MHYLTTTLLLAATVTAMPATTETEGKARRSLHSSETLTACAQAPNCETYESDHGTMIRFVPGMEPNGTANGLGKRDGSDVTHVTIGDGSLNYGTKGASGNSGAIHHLYDACHEGSCDRSGYSVDTTIVYPTNAGGAQLILQADGQYDGWDERNAFVEAVVGAASQGEKCEVQQWTHGTPQFGVETGSENQCTQTNFISVNRFGRDHHLKGFMSVLVSQAEDAGSGWCGEVAGILGAIAGVIGGLPAGFFGVVSAVCQ